MNRSDLLGKVKQVSPALSDMNILPIMACIWFEGKQITAYNDRIGITVDYETGYTGAVHGPTLIKLLDHTHQQDLELVKDEFNLIIKGGKTKMTLAARDVPKDLFVMPKRSKNVIDVDMKVFAGALEVCQRSVSDATTRPEHRGITLIPDGDKVNLFAITGPTLTNVEIKMGGLKQRVILPHAFCDQFPAFAEESAHFEINLKEGYALVETSGARLLGKLIGDDANPLPLMKILREHTENMEDLVALPEIAGDVVECLITMIDDINTDRATVDIKGDQIAWSSSSKGRGDFTDKFALRHPDISLKLNPKLLKTGLDDGLNYVRFTDKAVLMSDEHGASVYLISTN